MVRCGPSLSLLSPAPNTHTLTEGHTQGWIHGHGAWAIAQKGPTLDLMLSCHCLERTNIIEEGALSFHFALGPVNYVARSGRMFAPFTLVLPQA